MSGQTRRKRGGRRKAKRLLAMRGAESRRHAESGVGHTASRGDPHVSHTRRQRGQPIDPFWRRAVRTSRARKWGRPKTPTGPYI